MAYTPSTFGTGGSWKFGYTTTDATWRGSNFSGAFARIGTPITARSGSAASNDLAAMSGRFLPAVSGIGGNHLTFGQIAPNEFAALQKTAGTSFDCSASTGFAFAGVISGNCGAISPTATLYESIFGFSFERLGLGVNPLTRELVIFALLVGGGNPATIVQTGLVLPANPTPVFFKYTSAGWVLNVKNVGRATGSFIVGTIGSDGTRLTIADSQGSATNIGDWRGGIWCMDWWQGDGVTTGTGAGTDESLILDALTTEYGTVTPTDLIVLLGDSRFAGASGHLGESIGGLLCDAFPTARVVNLANGGALSTNIAAQVTRATSSLTTLGLTPSRRVALVSIGANETVGSTSTSTFTAPMAADIAALRAAGFTVVFDDIFPVSNESVGSLKSDAQVVVYENNRQGLRAAMQSTVTAAGATALTYCDHGPFRVDLTGASTDAAKATVIREACRSRMFENALPSGNDPAVLTGGDGLHAGHEGMRYQAMMLAPRTAIALGQAGSGGTSSGALLGLL